MITGELKNKIDGLWEIFWTGGLTNPLDVIEQVTYLMFIHDLDETDTIKEKECNILNIPFTSIFNGEYTVGEEKVEGKNFKWSIFRDLPSVNMFEFMQMGVFPFIKNLHTDKNSTYSKYMNDAIFKIPTPQKLDQIIGVMDELFELMNKERNEKDNKDIKGDVYEYLLSKIATAGMNGQFRTPRHIIKMMVELLDPKPTDTICDPACGTSGFLVAAGEYVKEKYKNEILLNEKNKKHYNNKMFTGYDMDRTMLRIGAMNMMTHGVENPNIEYKDSLSDQNEDKEKYSIILANPPFKGSLDNDIVSSELLKVCNTKKTEILFLVLMLRMMKVGGRCAVIVPDSILFGTSKAHKDIREELIVNQKLEAVISMPSGVFKPYAGVLTAVLIFTKTNHGGTDKVWFYDMRADGYSLDDRRTQISENDIPDIISRFRKLSSENNRKRTEQSFFVNRKEILENESMLSINNYKKLNYIEEKFLPTEVILENLNNIEYRIEEYFKILEELL